MNRNDSICRSEFYRDTGFDIIRNWLKNNCLCSLNEDFFTRLTPLIEIQKISAIQDFCNEFLSAFQRKNPLPLETIPNISSWIDSLNINGFQISPENFRALYQLLILSSNIKRYLIKSDFPLWHVNGKNLMISKSCLSEIERIFDDSFQIKSDASPELKSLSHSISKTEGSIKDTMQKIFVHAKQKNWLGGDQIVFRNGRSVLPLKISQKRKVKGIIQDQSSSGQTAYIEPLEIIELNNKLTELHFSLTEEKHRLLRELTAFFQPYYNEIQESFNILKYIDQHNTMAKLAYQINAIRPEMNGNGKLKVEDAVNPLFSLVEKKAVSLDIELDQEKTLLLSGPNAGGKTVVLKSIGLYALMAQCGLYIPAKRAQFPVYTKFMADIGDRQSMENDLSTFSAHIQNISTIVTEANENSLILLDELGTGTDPEAGGALSQAIMEFFIKKHCTVIATTHLGSLKVWASDKRGIINGGMVFDLDALAPTYELRIGTPGASYALEISKRMGLNENIINRSNELMGDGSVNLENILGQLEKELLLVESLRIDLENRETKLEQIETQTFKKDKEINKIHKNAQSSALLEAEKIILSARREAENLIAEIRVNQADKKTIKKVKDQFQSTLEYLQIQDKKTEAEFSSLSEIDIQKGSIIYIPHLNRKGKIIHLPDKKNRVRVEVNGINLTLKLAELQQTGSSESSKSNSKTNISINKTSSIVKIQIDLRGMRVDEALHETEKHLDSALVSGMRFVHILHGKGTGVLMEAIHEFLSEQSFVTKFHFADEDQGGVGITVVEFE